VLNKNFNFVLEISILPQNFLSSKFLIFGQNLSMGRLQQPRIWDGEIAPMPPSLHHLDTTGCKWSNSTVASNVNQQKAQNEKEGHVLIY